jgi:hypothetical protein
VGGGSGCPLGAVLPLGTAAQLRGGAVAALVG